MSRIHRYGMDFSSEKHTHIRISGLCSWLYVKICSRRNEKRSGCLQRMRALDTHLKNSPRALVSSAVINCVRFAIPSENAHWLDIPCEPGSPKWFSVPSNGYDWRNNEKCTSYCSWRKISSHFTTAYSDSYPFPDHTLGASLKYHTHTTWVVFCARSGVVAFWTSMRALSFSHCYHCQCRALSNQHNMTQSWLLRGEKLRGHQSGSGDSRGSGNSGGDRGKRPAKDRH